MEFILGGLTLPMLPEKTTIGGADARMVEYETIALGQLATPRGRELYKIKWSGVFPGGDIDGEFVRSRAEPTYFAFYVNAWKDAGTLVRFTVTGTGIDFETYVKRFDYDVTGEYGGSGSLTYEIELWEARTLPATPSVGSGGSSGGGGATGTGQLPPDSVGDLPVDGIPTEGAPRWTDPYRPPGGKTTSDQQQQQQQNQQDQQQQDKQPPPGQPTPPGQPPPPWPTSDYGQVVYRYDTEDNPVPEAVALPDGTLVPIGDPVLDTWWKGQDPDVVGTPGSIIEPGDEDVPGIAPGGRDIWWNPDLTIALGGDGSAIPGPDQPDAPSIGGVWNPGISAGDPNAPPLPGPTGDTPDGQGTPVTAVGVGGVGVVGGGAFGGPFGGPFGGGWPGGLPGGGGSGGGNGASNLFPDISPASEFAVDPGDPFSSAADPFSGGVNPNNDPTKLWGGGADPGVFDDPTWTTSGDQSAWDVAKLATDDGSNWTAIVGANPDVSAWNDVPDGTTLVVPPAVQNADPSVGSGNSSANVE